MRKANFRFPGHLHLNRPSDRLSPRTPPAIFELDVRTNAQLTRSPNFPRKHSVSARTGLDQLLFAFHLPPASISQAAVSTFA